MRSFDEKKLYIRYMSKHFCRNKMSCQAVFNRISLDPILRELKDLKKLEKILISKRMILKKLAIMQRKAKFAKIKGSICNIPIEATNICNIQYM